MNKYVIELRPDCKVVQEICESDGKVSIGAKSINYLEELNSDYINEHFGDLQDEAYKKGINDGSLDVKQRVEGAYQKGLEDGRNEAWEAARKIVTWPDRSLVNSNTFDLDPGENIFTKYSASEAIAKLKAYEEKQKAEDKIKVGDEVEVLNSGNKYLIAWFAGTSLCGFAHDGVTCRLQPSDVRKTGRHFDIASILEEMRND